METDIMVNASECRFFLGWISFQENFNYDSFENFKCYPPENMVSFEKRNEKSLSLNFI